LQRGDVAAQQEAEAGSWNAILMAQTAQEKKNAAEAVLASPGAQARGLIGINVNDATGTVSLTYADPAKNTTFDIAPDGEAISLQEWAKKGAEVHGISDQQKAIRAGGFYGQEASTDFMGVTAKRQGPTATATTANVDPMQSYQSYVNSKMGTVDEIFKKTEEEGVGNLIDIFDGSGFTFEESGAGNNVTVTSPDGVSDEFGLNESNDKTRKAEIQRFKQFITNNATDDSARKWQNTQGRGAGDGIFEPK
jgi:hypothetical protein